MLQASSSNSVAMDEDFTGGCFCKLSYEWQISGECAGARSVLWNYVYPRLFFCVRSISINLLPSIGLNR